MKKRKISIVGAGPGDPGLITVRAMKCLKEADTILYDHLIDRKILQYCKLSAKKIFVGKKSGYHSISQEEIHKILLDNYNKGIKVVRLKNGDPFIFGRGGEEIFFLSQNNIPFEIIPGITSATGVPAFCGIPLTHRDISSIVIFVTGHEQRNKKLPSVNWENLAKIDGTLVVLMGLRNLKTICSLLIKGGKDPKTAIAIISKGTTKNQKLFYGNLQNIYKSIKNKKISYPTLIVIGDIVKIKAYS